MQNERESHLLAVDVGSTNVKFALFLGDEIVSVERVRHEELRQFLSDPKESWRGVTSAISSVSPSLHLLLEQELLRKTGIKPVFLGFQDIQALTLCVNEPETVGIDRLLNCLAALQCYQWNLIVIDLGTATTIDVVTNVGEFLGGMILPGVDAFKNSLFENTQQLSRHQDKILSQSTVPKNSLGKNTFEAISAGVCGGYFSLLKGLLNNLTNELEGNYQVIATGGGTSRIELSELVSEIRPNLSLEGIKTCFDQRYKG